MTEAKKATARRNAKDTIFADLFSIPKYLLQLFQALHPEMTDVNESDIKILTLTHVLFNRTYNDMGILVKNKLIILIEAQSTWSINILIRVLLYLASTYHDYIHDNGKIVYSSTKLEIPEPEFYIIYTGDKKIEKDFISLREDFFENPNAKLDLTARVIHVENKDDIIGQYIIFCHVFDEQRKIHGYSKATIENTIRICQNSNVLREYLESRKKEVIDIMFTLFSQEYATEAYGREQKIQGVVETCRKLGSSIENAINMVSESLGLSKDTAAGYVHEFWGN